MDPRDIRRWAASHRAAAAREAEEVRKHPLTAAEAFASALSLLAFDEAMNGSPFDRDDPVTARAKIPRCGMPGRNFVRGGLVTSE